MVETSREVHEILKKNQDVKELDFRTIFDAFAAAKTRKAQR